MIRLDGWDAYVQAVGAQLGVNGSDAPDRVQASKRRLRDSLERLERELNEAEYLANAARLKVLRVSGPLRKELSSPRPDGALGFASQRQAIMTSMAATERALNIIAVRPPQSEGTRLCAAIERTMRSMVRLEAELEAAEMQFCTGSPAPGDVSPAVVREIAGRLRALSSAIAMAARLTDENGKLLEAEIASSIGRVRHLVAALSR